MPVFNTRIENALTLRRQSGLTRSVNVFAGANQALFSKDNQGYINFSSNDYLGLAADSEVVANWQRGLDIYGAGSGASPLVTGQSHAHLGLEETLCDWLGYERAVLFVSGFSANQAVLFSLLNKSDLLLQDRLNHASLMEAGSLSPATMKRFRHNDVSHLERLLTRSDSSLVVTEGVFSMDGDKAPLKAISEVTEATDNWLMVDDAHGIGVLGEDGSGSCALAGIKPNLLIVTFGKAFGLSGAAVMCDESTGDYLTQFAKHHVYSTAMPPSQAHSLASTAKMIQQQRWRREKLTELQGIYNDALGDVDGFVQTDTPIKPFICGETDVALSLAENLRNKGFWVTAIRPPTVPKGSARLRITLTAMHSAEHVKQLCQEIRYASIEK
ncbi:8-amino-7-oxononanoate synthase [Vibrio sp. HN007]|uniref:8-amino-7-oxononanoate synthase n=1 Tax=Vibrio iocasae TaxID=3098914 RepID=UPI0035D40951